TAGRGGDPGPPTTPRCTWRRCRCPTPPSWPCRLAAERSVRPPRPPSPSGRAGTPSSSSRRPACFSVAMPRARGARAATPPFRHETLREVAYSSLPKRERLRLHLAIAEGLMKTGYPSYAADHLERAAVASLDLDPHDRTIPDRAADALAQAGNRARRRMENRSAIDYYERALAMSGPEEGWGE